MVPRPTGGGVWWLRRTCVCVGGDSSECAATLTAPAFLLPPPPLCPQRLGALPGDAVEEVAAGLAAEARRALDAEASRLETEDGAVATVKACVRGKCPAAAPGRQAHLRPGLAGAERTGPQRAMRAAC